MKKEIFYFDNKNFKIPVKFENGKLYFSSSFEADAVLKVSKIELVYQITIQIKKEKIYKGIKIAKFLIENQSQLFNQPIILYMQILISKNPENTNIQNTSLLNGFKKIILKNQEIIIWDTLGNFEDKDLDLFSFAMKNESNLKKIILKPVD